MKIALSTTLAFLILLMFVIVPALAQEGTDENEPNNNRTHATEITGLHFSGEVGDNDQADWFKLNGKEGTNPTIKLTYDAATCDIDLEVYNEQDLVGKLEDTTSPESGKFAIPDTCYLKVFAHDGHGVYTIDITPSTDTHSTTTTNDQSCAGPDEIEPNDTQDDADMPDSLTIQGYACDGEDDWFMLNGDEGTKPSIKLTYDETTCDIDLDVYSDDALVGSLVDTVSPESDTFDIPGAGYLDVYSSDKEGAYTITITPAPESSHRDHGARGGTSS